MSDLRSKTDWLAAVAADAKLGKLALRVAMTLASYFNNTSGRAWPSNGRLAEALGSDVRHVRRALNALIGGGHLERKRGGGRGRTNSYWRLNGGEVRPRNDETERRANPVPKGERSSPPDYTKTKRRRNARYRSLGGSSREPQASLRSRRTEGVAPRDERKAQQRRASREVGATRPKDLMLSPKMLEDAVSIAQWDDARAEQEFGKFCDFHDEHETRYRRWDIAWRNWCNKGAEIDARRDRGNNNRRSRLDSVMDGLRDWTESEKRKRREEPN
jgi:hypothetical protein